MRPPKNRGISSPRLYVMVWPSGMETSTCRWSTSTTQNSRDPVSRHRFLLSSISAAVFDGDKTSITRSGAPSIVPGPFPSRLGDERNIRNPVLVFRKRPEADLYRHDAGRSRGGLEQTAKLPLHAAMLKFWGSHFNQFSVAQLVRETSFGRIRYPLELREGHEFGCCGGHWKSPASIIRPALLNHSWQTGIRRCCGSSKACRSAAPYSRPATAGSAPCAAPTRGSTPRAEAAVLPCACRIWRCRWPGTRACP